MKNTNLKGALTVFLLVVFGAGTSLVAARDGREAGGYHRDDSDFRSPTEHETSYHPENEHPNEQYSPKDTQNWQHGSGYGYTHNGAHYNYYNNGKYFNYYHNGGYYNYYYKGNYFNYYNNGLYYLYLYNGVYYNNCNTVPQGYPNCP